MIISLLCRFSIQFLRAKIISQILSVWNLLGIFTFFVSTVWAESHRILVSFWGEVNIVEIEAARTLLAIGDTCQAMSSYRYLKIRKCSNCKATRLRKLSIESSGINGGVEIEHWMHWVSQDEQRFDELRTLEWKPRGRAPSFEGIGNWECSVFVISRGAKFDRTERVLSESFSRPRRTHRGHFRVYLGSLLVFSTVFISLAIREHSFQLSVEGRLKYIDISPVVIRTRRVN